jgi:hypothetical protein
VSIRRRLAYVAASVIAAAGMMTGHWMANSARAAGGESAFAGSLAILSWVLAGVVAVLVDRSVPPRAIALASLALPLVWFGMILVSEDRTLWFLGLLLIALFAVLTWLSAAATRWLLRPRRQRRSHRS